MPASYKEYSQLNLPSISSEMLEKWESSHAFEKSIELREGKEAFVFFEGPPSANGMPGIHHVISRTLKDLVCRYKTMQGFQVKRKGGWDTHGLPIELGVEKELGITKEDIGKKISVEDYNKKCREVVMRFKDKWDDITKKMGYWVDLNNPYVTFENNYIETLWWTLSELYKKGYLYESVSIQPYSPAAGTGLSSHELNQPGTYKDVKDTSAVVMFKVNKNEKSNFLFEGVLNDEVFLMAWTTTPWTLPSNLGLTVGPNIDYVLVQTFNPYTYLPNNVVLAKALINKYFKAEGDNGDFAAYKEADKLIPWKIITEFKGKQLEGISYEQLLPFEANSIEKIQEITPDANPFKVITGDFVTTEDGTGIVHTAPAFGADDFRVGQKNNLGILTLVDKQGKFVDGVGEFSGRYVKDYKDAKDYVDVNVDISVKLKKENRAFKVEKYEHSYPHCWRTDKPIIYYPLDAWFIKTTAVKDRMIELNKTINWKPASTGTGRFGNWLENMVDWNLSRSRFWGTPLPIWKTADGEEQKCISSIAELNEEIKKAAKVLGGDTNTHYLHEGILDLHKPYVDDIFLVSDSGKPMKRVPDLIDVWFDSGAMPYAQWHFPFENKEIFARNFPADFIAEGVDQTRGWFYTLHALGSLLKESVEEELKKDGLWEGSKMQRSGAQAGVAYKTVVSNGLVLDKSGNKMSKRLGNVVDPFGTINSYGADATRWYLITNASPWDSLKFDEEGIKEVQRKFFGTLYNTYQFFALYANVDEFAFKEKFIPVTDRPEIDQWILSSLNSLIKTAEQNFDAYEPTQAGRAIEEFVDAHLSNWYVRLCRRRFWKGEYEHDKICAYQTLYECLETLSRLIAPVAPFFADWLFNNLNSVTSRFTETSVHHVLYPKAADSVIDTDLEKRMQLAQDASSLILSLRKKVNIRVRQPLQKVFIPAMDIEMSNSIKLVEEIIKAETNIKEVEILNADNDFIRKKARANFKTLGKKLGAKMKWAAAEIEKFDNATIEKVQEGPYILNKAVEGEEAITITAEDLEIITDEIPGYEIAGKGSLTVALDISITEVLQNEGNAREFVNRVQNIRKDNNFELTDRIAVTVNENEVLQPSLIQFKDYICREILADSLEFVPFLSTGTQIEVNDSPLTVTYIKQASSMATKKKAVKPAAKKPAPKKATTVKPVKKVAPVKKQAKPVPKKEAKPVAKKPVAKPTKVAVKAKAKPAPVKKPVAKPQSKAGVKKPVAPAKPLPKTSIKTPVAVQKPVQKPMAKKIEEKPVKKEAPAKIPAKPAQKPMATNTKDIRVVPAKPVIIPKLNTKTARKYQPDFTKSVLDQPKNDPGAPIVRYSDTDLREFRELINRKLDAAKKELNYLQGLITRKDEMGGDESDNRYMTMEDGSLSMEREQLSQMASRQITFIDHLEKALMRIENKTYGICRITGKLIDKARLRAVPHATLSIEAKMGIVK